MQKEKRGLISKAFLIFLFINLLIFSSLFVSAIEITNKQDVYVNVMPNEKVCIKKQIEINPDLGTAYVLSYSDVKEVSTSQIVKTKDLILIGKDEEILPIEKGGLISPDISNPDVALSEDTASLSANLITKIPSKGVDVSMESAVLESKLREVSAISEEAEVSMAEIPTSSEVEFCYQMPDYETLKAQKQGEISFCAYQDNGEGVYQEDCEHSLWWNFDYGYRQQIIFYSNYSIANLSKIVYIPWNNYMKSDFSDITFTVQNDSDNFSEQEEAFELVNKSDDMYANYRLAVDLNCLINVSGICNQTHYVYYDADINNSNKTCSNCLNHTVSAYCSGSVFACNLFGIQTTCGNQTGCSWQTPFCSGTSNCSSCSVANCTSCVNCSLTNIAVYTNYSIFYDDSNGDNNFNFDDAHTFAGVNFTIGNNLSSIEICADVKQTIGSPNMTIVNVSKNILASKLVTNSTYNFVCVNLSLSSIVSSTQLLGIGCANCDGANKFQLQRDATGTANSSYDSNVATPFVWTLHTADKEMIRLNISRITAYNSSCNGANNNSCSVYNNETVCGKCTSCSWNTAMCIGTPTPCTFFNASQSSCENQATCLWNSLIVDTNSGLTYQVMTPVPHPVLINCIYNPTPYLENKIDAICLITHANNQTFKCNSLIYQSNGTLITSSPQNKMIAGVGNINYFEAKPENADNQIVNIEFDTRDLTTQPLISKVICVSNIGSKVTFTRIITPEYKSLEQIPASQVYVMNNMSFYLGLFLILAFLLILISVGLHVSGLDEWIKPLLIFALIVLVVIALFVVIKRFA